MTLGQATAKGNIAVRTMMRIYGREATVAVVAKYLVEADRITGGRSPADVIHAMAVMALERYKHFSMASILMAIRDGISCTDPDGRVYGAITWPKLALWLDRHEERILDATASEHAAMKEAPGNIDRRYIDRLERGSTENIIRQKDKQIEQLRSLLRKWKDE